MKWCCAFLALSLVAQSSSKEKALGQHLRAEILKEAKQLTNETAESYLKQVAERFAAGIHVDLVETDATDPVPLPGGFILVPANTLRKAKSETDFLRAFVHAVAHIELRHGFQSVQRTGDSGIPLIFMGGWNGVHPDPKRPNAMPMGFRKQQAVYEQEATDYALKKVAAEPDTEAFLNAKRSLQP
jgi:hypothetical protein